jgi:hypothetical protein
MTEEQFKILLSNQKILSEIYRQEKYQRYIMRNRAEKMRARLRKQEAIKLNT